MTCKKLLLPLAVLVCSCTSRLELKPESGFDNALWRGERAAVMVDVEAVADVSAAVFAVKGLPEGFASVSIVAPVMADGLGADYSQCGTSSGDGRDSLLVYDRITSETQLSLSAGEKGRVWLALNIPADAKPGCYRGRLTGRADGCVTSLPFEFTVSGRVLPAPHDWSFHLDLWQNPFSVARYFDVPLWSEEHFARMVPIMKHLADAGQKVVTATILERPWNGQTEDPFKSMVVKTRGRDGAWSYDYTAFDKWVEFMFSLGIDSQINCYSMIPWRLTFDYIDAESGELRWLEATPGSAAYDDYWRSFIKDFAAHLRTKGWFEKTHIAMDERPEESMLAALSIIKSAEPQMKVSLTGASHPALDDMIDDLCITFSQTLSDEVLEQRRLAGKTSTFYTCCAERRPNTYLVSDPMEATWLGWYAAAAEVDGYLRWAYNSWTADPENDARFRTWPAGDCFFVYPEGSSVRFERLMEGIQDYEKARILREEWEAEGASGKLEALEKALEGFSYPVLEAEGAATAIKAARSVLDAI